MSGAPAAERLAAAELEAAVEQLSPKDFAEGLKAVARKLPVAAGVETAAIRLRDTDGEGELHLVSSVGIRAHERRNPLFYLQSLVQARAVFALKSRHSLADALGFSWLDGDWLMADGSPIGTITVGCRTERRPTEEQRGRIRSCRRGNRPETQGRRPPAGDPRGSRAAGGAREPGCAGRGAKPRGRAPAAARAQHPLALQRGSVGDRDRRHLRHLATHRPHSREKRLPTTRHRLARGGRACE